MSEDSKDETSATIQTCPLTKQDELRVNYPRCRESCPDWEKLPYPAIVEIFRYLRDADRVKMAQVCCAFSIVLRDRSLWRKRYFSIDGRFDKRIILFTSIFGGHLKDVDINVWHDKTNSCRNISETLEVLLGKLKNARLRKFELTSLNLNRFIQFPELNDTITSCLSKFFQSQTDLKKLILRNCQFSQSTGTKIMEIISTSSGHRLKYIYLTEFLHEILNVSDLENFKETFKKFSNLTHITFNYSYLSDELLRHWAVNLRNTLGMIDIIAFKKEPHSHIILSGTWKELSLSCPKLKVSFRTVGFCFANEILHLLRPTVPLYYFLMIADMQNDPMYPHLSIILNYLVTCFKDILKDVKFSLREMNYTPDDDRVHLIEQCHQLKIFHYVGKCGMAVPNAICDRLKDSKSLLREVHISHYDAKFDPKMENKIKLIHAIFDYDDF